MELSFSDSLLLTRDLIIPKMFVGREIPKELKGNKLKQKLNDYLTANPSEKYVLNIKEMKSGTDCLMLLREHLDKLTTELNLPKDMFSINIAK